jgi:hypothetical protein
MVLVAAQILDGVSGTMLGVLTALIIADLTTGGLSPAPVNTWRFGKANLPNPDSTDANIRPFRASRQDRVGGADGCRHHGSPGGG